MTERRGLVIAAVVALLAVGALVDRADRTTVRAGAPPARGPVAPSLSAGASTWYCPLAHATPQSAADGWVAMQNTQLRAVEGVLSLYPSTGAPVSVALRAGPRARLEAHLVEFIKAPVVGAVVELEHGGVAVEETVAGPLGESTTPCATAAASRWYFAEGSTALNNTMSLGIFNPFPDDAIVDLDFATDQGRTSPGAFQGLVVAARSVLSVNVGDHVRRRDHVALTATARRGRIVVGRLQTRTLPRPGLVVSLAAPAPQRFWDFPDGIVGESIGERFHFYNPSRDEATVQLALTLDQGAAEPFELKVPAGDRRTLDPGSESRVPKGVGHAATVRSNVPIVVERTLDYAAPPRVGLSIALGATTQAREWLLPQGGATDSLEEWIVLHNLGRRSVKVSVTAITGGRRIAIEGLQDIELAAGKRSVHRLLDTVEPRPDLPLLVAANRPIVVERVLARVGRAGLSQSIAIPVGD